MMASKDKDESLFEEEHQALRSAVEDAEDSKYQGNILLGRYKWLINRYSKLLTLTRKIFRISDKQGRILYQYQSEIQNLLDNANQGFLTFGSDLKVSRQYSAECIRIFGRKIAGISILELVTEWDDINIIYWQEIFSRVFSSSAEEQAAVLKKLPSIIKTKDMYIRVDCKVISQACEEKEQHLIMMILTDITEKRKSEEHIKYLSYHDKLTSLYNRAYIDRVLPELKKAEAFPLSIIIVDMNGLKLVNDVFGHVQGDRLLVAMAQSLVATCRSTDVIARWGGDEFLILLPKTNRSSCQEICQSLYAAFSEAKETPIPLSAAVGVATADAPVTSLAELFSVAESRMYSNKLAHRQVFRQKIIEEMENKLHEQCFESVEHRERIFHNAARFAAFLGYSLDSPELRPLKQLAALHDIGKVAIPKEILEKPATLTPKEWKIVKGHIDIGYRMAQSIGELALAEIMIALYERWDGNGYPYGLSGQQIPLLARLFALVHVYEVLTHERPYAKAMSKEEALSEISAGIGSQFDPELTKSFLRYMDQEEYKGKNTTKV